MNVGRWAKKDGGGRVALGERMGVRGKTRCGLAIKGVQVGGICFINKIKLKTDCVDMIR